MAKKEYKPIKVDKLIKVLQKLKHKKIADVEFWVDGEWAELESIGQFSIIPSATIHLKSTKEEVVLKKEK